MRTFLRAMCVCALMVSPAAAGGFAEVVGGVMVPVAEDDYTDVIDESLKLGVRLGSLGPGGYGPEVAADWTAMDDGIDEVLGVETALSRYRLQLGARFGKPIGRNAEVFGRVAGGVDIVHFTADGTVVIVDVDYSETDLGIAAEVGAGVAVNLGKVSVGGQVALPMAFHFEEDDPADPQDIDLEYTGIDIDLLFTVAVKL